MGSSRTVLITGAGQGIGLEWVRQEAADGATVIATAREPGESSGLEAVMRERPGKITARDKRLARIWRTASKSSSGPRPGRIL